MKKANAEFFGSKINIEQCLFRRKPGEREPQATEAMRQAADKVRMGAKKPGFTKSIKAKAAQIMKTLDQVRIVLHQGSKRSRECHNASRAHIPLGQRCHQVCRDIR